MKKNPISTRRIFPSSQVPPSSFITYAVIVLIFVLFISFMLFRTSSQQDNLINMNSRLIELEQTVQKSVQSSEVTVESLADDLKDANREIRKLWDLSNKGNKKRITALEDKFKSIEDSINEILTQSQDIRLISKEFAKSISDIKSRVARLDSSSLSSSDYEIRIKELEEATKSMDSFRRQTNQSLIKLRKDLEEFESSKEQDSQ
jgi:septal ring factor EnvC (AmiA/AmiB activator)